MLELLDLPEEMLINVMSYLSLSDRKNVRLTCRRLCHLSYTASLIKNDITTVSTYPQLAKLNTKKKYRNIKIKEMYSTVDMNFEQDKDKGLEKFWTACGTHVQSLELYNADLYDPRLRDIFIRTENLEYLLVSQYDENDHATKVRYPFRSQPKNLATDHFKFPKLLSLDLLHFQNASVFGFAENLNSVVEDAPLIKRLSLEWFGLKQYTNPPKDFMNKFFKKQGNILKELNMSYTLLDEPQCLQTLSLIGPQLTGLYFRKCKNLTNECVLMISKKFPNLKEIDLSMNNLCDESLSSLVRACPNLSHISLAKTRVGPLTLPLIAERSKLVALELSNCPMITSKSILEAFGKTSFPKLIDLRLDNAKLTDLDVKTIIEKFPKLTLLCLNGCRKLTDDALTLISHHATNLRSLSIRNWTKLRDVACVNNLRGLVHLDVYGCKNVRNIVNISLLELQTLDISEIDVPSNECKELLKRLPSIEDVYLDIDMENHLLKYRHPTNRRFKFHFGLAHFTTDSIFDS